jgi:fumarylacetoacetase
VSLTDATHDPALKSWVASAEGHADFPIQNLPFGVFSAPGGGPRVGVAIGDQILDLADLARTGLIDGAIAEAAGGATLNALFALPAAERQALRRRLSALLAAGAPEQAQVEPLLHPAKDCVLHLPAAIGDYTDFYAGIHHALNIGRQFRPDAPLLPNYKYVPIGYHGRASTVRPSGAPVRRPSGQRKGPNDPAPEFGPCRRLDYEVELGLWVGPGAAPGAPIPIVEAGQHLAGISLLNDWSARDLQAWEYQPLGPFLAKSFVTTVSPWVVTTEALAPFRKAQGQRPEGDPAPLPYLWSDADQATGAFDIEVEVWLTTARMREQGLPAHRLSKVTALDLYWTAAQMLAHHTSNGCDLRPGDLLGTGTISSPRPGDVGSLMELSVGGREPVALPTGETRTFLEDGDELAFTGRCSAAGAVSIGFGDCRGRVEPA